MRKRDGTRTTRPSSSRVPPAGWGSASPSGWVGNAPTWWSTSRTTPRRRTARSRRCSRRAVTRSRSRPTSPTPRPSQNLVTGAVDRFGSIDVRRGERRRQRLQAPVGDPRQAHRQDDGHHDRRLPRARPGRACPTCPPAAGSWPCRVGQLPRPARARSPRRGEGRHGDAREVPRHRARAGRRHHGGRVPRADRHGLVPDLRRRSVGLVREELARDDALGRTSPHRTRSRRSWPSCAHRAAPRSTARRSWSTAGSRSPPCPRSTA